MTVQWTVKKCIRWLVWLSFSVGISFALALVNLLDGWMWWSFTFTFLAIFNSAITYNLWSALIQQLEEIKVNV